MTRDQTKIERAAEIKSSWIFHQIKSKWSELTKLDKDQVKKMVNRSSNILKLN